MKAHPRVDPSEPIRVRFLALSAFAFDIEVFAYVFGANQEAFLETQQELLFAVMEILERADARIALPTQRLQLMDASGPAGANALQSGLPDRGPAATARPPVPSP